MAHESDASTSRTDGISEIRETRTARTGRLPGRLRDAVSATVTSALLIQAWSVTPVTSFAGPADAGADDGIAQVDGPSDGDPTATADGTTGATDPTDATSQDGQATSGGATGDDEQGQPQVWLLSLDPNGGELTEEARPADGEDDPLSLEVVEDETTVPVGDPSLAREAYHLKGWSTTPDNEDMRDDSDRIVKAHQFVPLGASLFNLSYRYVELTDEEATGDPAAIRMGGSWVRLVGDAHAAGTLDEDGHVVMECDLSQSLDGDTLTLYAQWARDAYSIRFDANGGSGKMDDQRATVGEETTLSRNRYSLEGSDFAGWNDAADGSGHHYDDGQAVTSLSERHGDTVVLYAQWARRETSGSADGKDGKSDGDDDADADPDEDKEADDKEASGTDGRKQEGKGSEKSDKNDTAADEKSSEKPDDKADGQDGGEADGTVSYDKGETGLMTAGVQGDAATDERATVRLLMSQGGLSKGQATSVGSDLFSASDGDGSQQPARSGAKDGTRGDGDGEGDGNGDGDGEGEGDQSGRSGDGTNIEGISVRWITADTIDDGDAANLYLQPTGDSAQTMRLRLNYALSGEHDYNPGDVNITIPASIWTYRDGTEAGTLEIPYPEDPSASQEFNWRRVGDTYVISNTRRMSAATKGFIDLEIADIIPHRVVDHADSNPFMATIEVLTHKDNLLSLSSNEIKAQIDTEARIQSAYKSASKMEWVPASEIPSEQRISGEDEYLVITWRFYAYVLANTAYTVDVEDVLPDEYDGFVIGTDGLTWSAEGVYHGTGNGSTAMSTIKTAYPASRFEKNVRYQFHNNVTYTLTEDDAAIYGDDWFDEQKTTTDASAATATLIDKTPEFTRPTGNLMLYKLGNDGRDGGYRTHYTYSRNSTVQDTSANGDAYVGVYNQALFDIQDGEEIELSYTYETIGRLLPWIVEGDPKVLANYGRRAVTLTTYDTDDTSHNGRLWLSTGQELVLGQDYDYTAIEFPTMPAIGKAHAVNINPDGTFPAGHSVPDGTYDWTEDNDPSHIPTIRLEAEVGGTWQQIATVDWSSGSCVITPTSPSTLVAGRRVMLPAGTTRTRTTVTSTNAYISYYTRPIFVLREGNQIQDMVDDLFEGSLLPSIDVCNSARMIATDADSQQLVDIKKTGRDIMQGYNADVWVVPQKSARQVRADYDTRNIVVHYEAKVEERTFINSAETYRQAVADGRIIPETSGIWYDLLPVGVTPNLSTIRMGAGDSIEDSYTIENYKGTGRTLLVVKARLTPSPTTYPLNNAISGVPNDNYYQDVISIEFDATYPFDSIIDHGSVIHNVIAFESTAKDAIGTLEHYRGEPDNPVPGTNNVRTPSAFADDGERQAMTNLDASRDTPSFVYAGAELTVNVLSSARTSLSKDVQVNNDGVWSAGTYEDRRDVYEGGQYAYQLRMMSNADTISKDLIMFDSLENFHALACDQHDPADVNAPRWQGRLRSVDTLQLESMGCAPVVYYSTVANLQLSDESDPTSAVAIAANTDLENTSVWVPADEYQGSLADVKAVAIDARKKPDGTDFELHEFESAVAVINMIAPTGAQAGPLIEANAHAYNNAYLMCTSIDASTGGGDSDNFVRKDYTKVGLVENTLTVTKLWDDDRDRDGIRPSSVTVRLYANDVDTGQSVTLDDNNDWADEFAHLPYADANGEKIRYRLVEDGVTGYEPSIAKNGNSHTITNRHDPTRISVNGTKQWVGDSDAVRPASIRVNLLANGRQVSSKVIVPASDGTWSYSFDDVFENEGGQPIDYTVTETVDSAYIPAYDGFDITNTYHPFGDLVVDKDVIGATAAYANRRFAMRIDLTDAGGQALLGDYEWTTSDGRSGTLTSGDSIEISATETLTVHEIEQGTHYEVSEAAYDGYTITQSSGLTGSIIANRANQASITNTYAAVGRADLRASKTLEGREMNRFQFRFEVLDEQGNVLKSASNQADGSVTFGSLSYTEADAGHTYTYRMREQDKGRAGYTYDTAEYLAVVEVSDNGDGTLACDISYKRVVPPEQDGGQETYEDLTGDDVPSFENVYEAEGSIRLRAWKRLQGGDLNDYGPFEFELVDEQGNVLQTKQCNSRGEVYFDTISYDEGDAGHTYNYVVREKAGNDTHVIYDDSLYAYAVSIEDNGDGTLTCSTGNVNVEPIYGRTRLHWSDATEAERRGNIWFTEPNSGGRAKVYNPTIGADIIPSSWPATTTISTQDTSDMASVADIINELLNADFATSDFSTASISNHASDTCDLTVVLSNTTSTTSKLEVIGNGALEGSTSIYFLIRNSFSSAETTVNQWDNNSDLPVLSLDDEAGIDMSVVDGYNVSSDEEGEPPAFVNELQPGGLSISKSTMGNVPAAHQNDEFTFKVQLTGENLPDTVSYTPAPNPNNGQGNEQNNGQGSNANGSGAGTGMNMLISCITNVAQLCHQAFGLKQAYAATSWTNYTDNNSSFAWRIDEDNVLRIKPVSGNTGVINYGGSSSYPPWYSDRNSLTGVSIPSNYTMQALTCLYLCAGSSITSVDLSGLDTSSATTLTGMFYGSSSLSSVDLTHLNTSNVANMTNLFSGCRSLTTLNLTTWNTSNVTNMNSMFYNCPNLTSLNISNFDTHNVTTMNSLFYGCSNISNLDLSTWDLSNLNNAPNMFRNCTNLTQLTLPNGTMNNLTNMSYMFANCGLSSNALDNLLATLDTSNVTNMSSLLRGCQQIQTIDLSGIDTSSLTNATDMLSDCPLLTTVTIGTNFTSVSPLPMGLWQSNSTGTVYTDETIPHGVADTYTSVDSGGWGTSGSCLWRVDENGVLIIKPYGDAVEGTLSSTKTEPWSAQRRDIQSVRFEGTIHGTNCSNFFSGCANLTTIDWTNFDSSGVTTMDSMFNSCTSLTDIDLSTLDTHNVTNMSRMLQGCSLLTDIDLSVLDTSNVTNITSIVSSCSSLKNLDMSGLDLHGITSMNAMFVNMTSLETVNFSGINTSNVTTMASLFRGCTNLKTIIGLSDLDTGSVTTMNSMFQRTSIEEIDISNWDTHNVTDMVFMFYGCEHLVTFNATGIDVSNVKYFGDYFNGRYSTVNGMFCRCTSLRHLDLSTWVTSSAERFGYMFASMPNLETLDIRNFTMSSADDGTASLSGLYHMFGPESANMDNAKLSRITLGPEFRFHSYYANYSDGHLPNPPSGTTTGYWVNIDNDSGIRLTSTQLYQRYDGSDEMVGTWVWQRNGTYINYDANDGVGPSMPPQFIAAGTTEALLDPTYAMFDNELVNWNTEQDGSGTTYDTDATYVGRTGAMENITLYAQWQPIDHTQQLEDNAFYVTLPAGYTATIDNLPAGTGYAVFEETQDGWVLVSQSNTSGEILPLETAEASFTNQYQENITTAQIVGVKTLDGRPADAEAFSFELVEDGNVIQTVSNITGGAIMFDPIVYRKNSDQDDTGEHLYLIREVQGDDQTMTYDTETSSVRVNVVETDGNKLSAQVSYLDGDIRFENRHNPGNLRLTKNVVGQSDANADDEFTFTIRLTNPNGETLDSVNMRIGTIDSHGNFVSETNSGIGVGLSPYPATSTFVKNTWGALANNVYHLFDIKTAYADIVEWTPYTDNGSSIEWMIDDDGIMTIRPISGNRGILQYNILDNGELTPPWQSNKGSIKHVHIADTDTIEIRSSAYNLFQNCVLLTDGDFDRLDTSQVTSMSGMFLNCKVLNLGAEVSNWDTAQVTSMREMFSQCYAPNFNPDVSQWDVGAVTDMMKMFYNCSGAAFQPDVSSWDVSHVIKMQEMFRNCSQLTSINVSQWDVHNVTTMAAMFYQCSRLREIDVSQWNTSSLTVLAIPYQYASEGIFGYCSSLTSLDVSNWNVSKVTNLSMIFYSCTSLVSLDIAGWDSSSAGWNYSGNGNNAMYNIVGSCSNLRRIHLGVRNGLYGSVYGHRPGCGLADPPQAYTTKKWINEDNPEADPLTSSQLYNLGPALTEDLQGWWVWQIKDDKGAVHFDGNGGACSAADITISSETQAVTMPTATRDGYILIGWNTEPDGSGTEYVPGATVTNVGRLGTMVTLYAQWERGVKVTIRQWLQTVNLTTYSLATTSSQTLHINETKTFTPGFRTSFVTPSAQTVTAISPDSPIIVDFYYDRTQYDVGFNGNDADTGWMDLQHFIGGVSQALSQNLFAKTGSVFVGWATGADSEAVYTNMQSVVNLAGDGELFQLFAKWLALPSVPASTDGTYTVKLKGAQTLEMIGLPAGTTYEIVEGELPTGWSQTNTANTDGTIVSNETAQASITNTYAASGEFTLQAWKRLIGRTPAVGEFSFELRRGNALIETVSNDAIDTSETITNQDDGTVSPNPHVGTAPITFSPVAINAPGTYVYTIREVAGNEQGMTYDTAPVSVTVTATDAGHGNLSYSVAYASGRDTFENEVAAGALDITKNIDGSGPSDATFTFDIDLKDATGATLSEGDYNLILTPAEQFSELEPSGTTPDSPSSLPSGSDFIIFDANGGFFGDGYAQNTVTIQRSYQTVTKVSHTQNFSDDGTKNGNYGHNWGNSNVTGTDRPTGDSNAHVISFPGAQSLDVSINYGGESASYDWVCMWAGNYPNYTAASNYGSSTTGRLGGGNFSTWSRTVQTDTVTFSFRSDGSGVGSGYGYFATVTGQMLSGGITGGEYAEPTGITSRKSFAGWYTDAACTPGNEFDFDSYESEGGKQVIVYAKWEDDMHAQQSDATIENGRMTVTLGAGDVVRLDGLPSGATYSISEREAAPWSQVGSSGETGTIYANGTSHTSFTNRYVLPDGEFGLQGTKRLEGRDIEDGEFTFELLDGNGEFVARATNDEDGTISFPHVPMTQEMVGETLTYTIHEIAGSDSLIHYDDHVESVDVTVSDAGGHLEASVSYDSDGMFFENVYMRPPDMPGTGLDGLRDACVLAGLAAVAAGALAISRHGRRRRDATDEMGGGDGE